MLLTLVAVGRPGADGVVVVITAGAVVELNRSVNPQKSAPVTSKACARARTTGCDLVMVGIIAKSSINDLGAWANG